MWDKRIIVSGLSLLLTQVVRADDEFFTFHGAGIGTSLGRAVDGAGDVNGDGVGDLVIGASGAFGLNGSVSVRSGKDGSLLHSWTGAPSFGRSVAGAGDVNQDGFADVIVGETGKAHVYSGKDGSLLYTKIDVAGQLGTSVDGAGDVDQDGYADVVVGAPFGEIPGRYGIGYIRVFSGKTGAVLIEQLGDIIGDWFGYSVSGGGDCNKDGYPDLIVGAPRWYFHAYLGRACVISGKDGAYLGSVKGVDPDGFFGGSVAGGADLNRDGYADFVVGSPDEDIDGRHDVLDVGFARSYSGKDFSLMHDWLGGAAGAHFGKSVAMAGRVNDDLYPDVVVGSPHESSWFSVGKAYVLSGKDGSTLRAWAGAPFDSGAFGTAVAGAGDINDDGFADVIASDPSDGAGAAGAGMVTVRSGLTYSGSATSYGAGWPGTFGVPDLAAVGTPALCDSILLSVENSRGATTAGVILVGFSQAAIDSHMGGLVLVGFPWFVFPITIPSPGLDLPMDIVCDTTLAGIEVYLQVLEADPGASWGASFSKGLVLVLGL